MQYKLDFVVSTLLYALLTAVDFLTVAAILYRYPTVGGWNIYEIALLSGIMSTAYGIYRTMAAELHNFEHYLVTGEFDNLLTRPWPTLASLLTRGFDLGRIGAAVQGMVLTAVGLSGVARPGLPVWLAFYVWLLPLAGAVIILSMNLAAATAGFWLTRIDELTILMTNAPQAAANYPISIYPTWLRRLLLGVIPVGTVAYVPLVYALGKGGSALYLWAPFMAAVVFITLSLRLWRLGERHYQSTGS